MKAVVQTRYGGPEVLELRDVETPTPSGNEILIKIKAASVTAADTMMRTGRPLFGRLFTGLRNPKNPRLGTGFAGVVADCGEGVSRFSVGDEVFGEVVFGPGTYADYVLVPEDGLVSQKPAHLGFDDAAGICDGPLTSMNLLVPVAGMKAGQKVLVNGASGSLGSAAVQLARHLGAEVTAVCGPKNVDFVKSLGADHVIDYSQEDFTRTGQAWDVIYDAVGKSSFSSSRRALTAKGVYVSPVLGFGLLGQMLLTSLFGKKKARFAATGMMPVSELHELLKPIMSALEERALSPHVDRQFPLEQAAEAHRLVDTGHKRGNVVLVMAGNPG